MLRRPPKIDTAAMTLPPNTSQRDLVRLAVLLCGERTSAKGSPNRNRTCVAPAVPSDVVSSRWVALRTVWAAAAMTVNSAQSQEESSTYPSFVIPGRGRKPASPESISVDLDD